MKVRVLIWFDIEDYVTPESDVALGRLIDIMDRHSVRGTFKMVGEKVRGLQRRGHYDILARLRGHDIGYHTDYHSKPPSIPEYLLPCDWAGGIAEFSRRESAGLATVRQAFQRTPSCYGQPGGSWAPHVYPVLRQWGIPVYLDAGPWVALDGRPHWYCGVLNLLGLTHTMHIGIGGGRGRVEQRSAELVETVGALRHTGGEISLYAHECEFVTSQFWDAINYGRGRDTPRDQWQPAPLVSDAERESRFAAMDAFLGTLATLPDVEIVVTSEAPMLYADRARGRAFTAREIADLCAPMADRITHREYDGAWLSPAEVLSLAVRLLAARVRTGEWPEQTPYAYLDGPVAAPDVHPHADAFPLDDLYGTCLYESAAMELRQVVPSEVQIGRTWLSPADLLATLGAALPGWLEGGDEAASLVKGRFVQARHVADHVSWDWAIFPPGFDGDALLEPAKRQAWTLKPAS